MKFPLFSASSSLSVALVLACAACASPSSSESGAASQAESANGPSGGTCAERPRDFEGDQAKDVIQALMFANVTPVSHVATTDVVYTDTYQVDALSCQDTHAYDDGITRFDCQSPKVDQNATAKVLFDAIYGLGIYGDAGLGHTFADVSAVTCKLEVTENDGDKYTCSVTGTWADDCK